MKITNTMNPESIYQDDIPALPEKEELFADLLLEMIKNHLISEQDYIEWLDEKQRSRCDV